MYPNGREQKNLPVEKHSNKQIHLWKSRKIDDDMQDFSFCENTNKVIKFVDSERPANMQAEMPKLPVLKTLI